VISIDRASKTYAVFDGFNLRKPFMAYEDEREACGEAMEWLRPSRCHPNLEPRVLFPRVTKLRASS